MRQSSETGLIELYQLNTQLMNKLQNLVNQVKGPEPPKDKILLPPVVSDSNAKSNPINFAPSHTNQSTFPPKSECTKCKNSI